MLRRHVLLAVVGLSMVGAGNQVEAQVFGGRGFQGNDALRQAQFVQQQRHLQRLHRLAHRGALTPLQHQQLHYMLGHGGYNPYATPYGYGYPVAPVIVAPPVNTSRAPFAGSPSGGNYFYWLSNAAARGQVSRQRANQLLYPSRGFRPPVNSRSR